VFRIRACVALALATAVLTSLPAHASATPSRRLFILWLDGLTIEDWAKPSLPNFHRLLNEAAVGLLSTRTAHESTDPTVMRENAAVTFGAGAQAGAFGGKPLKISGASPGLLGDALHGGGYGMLVGVSDTADTNAALAFARSDGALPPIRPIHEHGGLIGPETGPPVRAVLADASHEPLTKADEMLGAIFKGMSARDLLVVVSGDPPVARQKKGIRLSAVAIIGPGFGPGLLTSGTTRRDGLITLTDLAPTIADALGLPPLKGVTGRVATVVPRAHAATYLQHFDSDIVRAALDRYPLTRWMLIIAMALVVIALAVTVFAGPAPSTRARIPRGARDWLATLLLAAAASPLSLYVNGAFHPSSLTVAAIEAAAVALGLALIARAAVGLIGGLVIVLGLTAIVPLIDLLIGTPLGVRSPIAFQVAGGGRFYGVDGGMLGVVVGAEIFAAALLIERARDPHRAGRLLALTFAASVWLLGAPSYGSKFGAALTAVPAFGVLAVLIAGKRLTRASVAVIAVATLAVTGLLIGVDALRTSGAQSHVARAVEGKSGVGAIISRKVHLQWVTTVHTIWTPAILVFAGAIVVVLWQRRDLVARAMEWHTQLRAALLAALVGGIAGFVFNDGGVLVTAPIAMFSASVVFTALLTPG
jgi:hypothetical protein